MALPAEVGEPNGISLDWWAGTNGTCTFRNLTSSGPSLRSSFDAAQIVSPQTTPMPADLELALGFDVPENMSRVYFSLGNVSGESLPPGEMPYNSTLWLNGSAISLSAPFLDVGHGCSGNNGSAAWATASATKGNRSLWTYLVKKGRYATRHRGTSGVSRAPYSGWGSPSRLHGWLAALFAIYGSLYGVGS